MAQIIIFYNVDPLRKKPDFPLDLNQVNFVLSLKISGHLNTALNSEGLLSKYPHCRVPQL